jgi:septal ring factor EnvC (AmiA/AmiB activator)
MTDDEERLVAEIPAELKALVDADGRTNKDIVEAALWREFGGHRQGALDRRIEEQERRVNMIESEIDDRNTELDEEEAKLAALKKKRESVEESEAEKRAELESVIEQLSDVPRDPTNPAIKTKAKKVGMTPEELIEELPDRDDGGELHSL